MRATLWPLLLACSRLAPCLAAEPAVRLGAETYAAQQADLKALNDSGRFPLRSYALAKSQCWLDVSFHEYSRNDRSAFPAAAWLESHRISEELKADGTSPAALTTPLVNGATRLRPDLWDSLAHTQASPGASCAEALVACAEVELVHAGNEYRQIGWRHAKPYLQIAEDHAAEAAAAAEHCATAAPAPVPVPVPTSAPAAAGAAAPATVAVRDLSMGAAGLFGFDKYRLDDLLPDGRRRLDELIVDVRQHYASITNIRIVGSADRLGSAAYNKALSLKRARSVQAYLESQGLNAPYEILAASGTDAKPRCTDQGSRSALQQCLQPDRRVDITVTGLAQ